MWSFPRPPAVEHERRHLRVVHAGVEVASSNRGVAVLETSHPPTFYVPPEDVRMDLLVPVAAGSRCEWKGRARYFDLVIPADPAAGRPVDVRAEQAAFCYPEPTPRFAAHAGWISFYAGRVEGCFVDDEPVTPQPGDFYSGWITRDLAGPFKGEPGSMGW